MILKDINSIQFTK